MTRQRRKKQTRIRFFGGSRFCLRLSLIVIAIGQCLLSLAPHHTIFSSPSENERLRSVASVDQHWKFFEKEGVPHYYWPVPEPSAANATTHVGQHNRASEDWRQFKNRTIAFVHVGKAGGLTLRASTSLACGIPHNNSDPYYDRCIDRHFAPNAVLSRQVQHVVHMHVMPPDSVLEDSTTFLINLRNPVDRIVSTYRYSHPANCNHDIVIQRSGGKPYGCIIEDLAQTPSTSQPLYEVYTMFNTCFPLPAMENFAQSVLAPYPKRTNAMNLEPQQQERCQKAARGMVQGKGPVQPAPHMQFNFEHYAKETIWNFPDKEVFALRTEHQWTDLKALDLAIGGEGRFPIVRSITHGSQYYAPSPLSAQAYHKLCCVLEKEISIYEEFLSLAVNLNEIEKQESMEDVKKKCGITTSWEEWRRQCEAQMKL